MILIAHRALFDGPDQKLENHPDQIKKALSLGYNCEVDVRWHDGTWFLGHDHPSYKVNLEFLLQDGLWLHCKNAEALFNMPRQAHYFWHQKDDHAMTSRGYVWTYPGLEVSPTNGVLVQPEWFEGFLTNPLPACHGVCSKFVSTFASEAIK